MKTLQDVIENPSANVIRDAVAATLAEIGADRADYLKPDATGVAGSPDDRTCPQLADAAWCCPDGLELDVFDVAQIPDLDDDAREQLCAALDDLWRAEVARQLAALVAA